MTLFHGVQVTVCVMVLSTAVFAQQVKPETKTGTLKEIVAKNRTVTVSFTDSDGQDHTVIITPKIKFEIRGKGDEGFVSAGQYVEGTGVVTNDKLFVSEVTVYMFGPGKKAPAGQIAKAPRVEGESQNSYRFGGTVISRMPDSEFEGYQRLAIQVGGRVPPIMLEKEYSIDVVTSSVEMAKAGMPVEFDMVPGRGGRSTCVRIAIQSEEPFASADVIKPPGKK